MDTRILAGLTVFLMVVGANAISEVELNVDEVIVYPQSVALIYESGAEGAGAEFMAGVNRNAYANSIRVSGASEMSVLTGQTYYPYYGAVEAPIKQLLEQVLGKRVRIGGVEGVLEWIGESWIGMSNSTNFITMPISSATIVSSEPLQEPNETQAEQPESVMNVTWMSDGGKQVRISYLANGLSWTPVYFLDAGSATSRFEFWAKINNEFEDLSADVKLIGGDVKISVGDYRRSYDYMSNTQMAMEASGASAPSYFDEAPTVSTAGEYEVYDLGQKEIEKGESRLISIFAGSVTPEKEYVWDTRAGDKVQRIYIMKNPGKTWTYGSVKVYENGMLMGEDTISWTPKGRKARITIGNAPDIEVSKKTTSVDIRDYKHKHTTTLKLKNYKSSEVQVNLIDVYPTYIDQGSFESRAEFVQKPGNLMELNITLSAGEEKKLVYMYTT